MLGRDPASTEDLAMGRHEQGRRHDGGVQKQTRRGRRESKEDGRRKATSIATFQRDASIGMYEATWVTARLDGHFKARAPIEAWAVGRESRPPIRTHEKTCAH